MSGKTTLEHGDIVKVFDSLLWAGKDVGNNSQFWKEARIIGFGRTSEGEEVVTVQFLYDGRISHGHFVSGVRT